MVRDWITNPNMNFGLLLNSDASAGSDSNRFFASSEADPNQRPKLVVTYITGLEVNVPPTINSFTSTPSGLNNPGETTTFNVSATDPDGDSLTYTISFGDGTANEIGSHVVHTYDTKGTYTATATVGDGNGHSVGRSLQVTVNDIPPAEPTNVSAN
jgi:PKD repeat protein